MPDEPAPSDEAKKRHEPDGFYRPYGSDDPERVACTCHPSCPRPCHGECGCKACSMAYQDFLSFE